MTYHVGQLVELTTALLGTGTPPTMTVVVTRPDATTTTVTLTRTDDVAGWTWRGSVLASLPGDYLYVFTASGSHIGIDDGQFHVVTPALRIVGLGEVKEHGNITAANADRELRDFIDTATQMIEHEVGAVVPATYTELHRSGYSRIWLDHSPVLSVTSISQYNGATLLSSLVPGEWELDAESGSLARVTAVGGYISFLGATISVTYRAGRQPIPEAIRWAAKELTIHLWRATQAQRGGRGRGGTDADTSAAALGYALPNRVADVLLPFKKAPAVY